MIYGLKRIIIIELLRGLEQNVVDSTHTAVT